MLVQFELRQSIVHDFWPTLQLEQIAGHWPPPLPSIFSAGASVGVTARTQKPSWHVRSCAQSAFRTHAKSPLLCETEQLDDVTATPATSAQHTIAIPDTFGFTVNLRW